MSKNNNLIWDDDKLDRKASADYLTTYLNALFDEEERNDEIYKSSFVLNINAGWGYGKTFFIEKWVKELKVNKQPVIYFDAWKTDFAEDPLLAFIAELEDGLKPYFAEVPKGTKILNAAFKAAKNVLKPIIVNHLNAVVSTATGGIIKDINPVQQENLVEISLKAYKAKKIAIADFKKKLNDLVTTLKGTSEFKLPIYIFIDELDRCRPTYAVSLLEAIKHIFGVSGFYFIVATNRNELAHSVKAIYGVEFDALTYLRRFFDQEYNLPKPNNEKFAIYLMDRFRILSNPATYFTPISKVEDGINNSLAFTFSLIATGLEIPLRDQVQIAIQLKSILLTIKYQTIHFLYLIFIIMLKQKSDKALYKFLENLEYPDEYRNLLQKNIVFDGFTPSLRGSSPGKISLEDVLETYRKNANINSINLHSQEIKAGTIGDISRRFYKEAPSSYNQGQHFPLTISNYPTLVLQAGHLNL